jgi:hypothetical protein
MKIDSYIITEGIGVFSDELSFKNKLMYLLKDKKAEYKAVFAIENREEPGMPDLVLVNNFDEVTFAEIKYAEKGKITFKRTQIPWYMRHRKLNIVIIAYNDITKNIHFFTVDYLLSNINGRSFKLEEENL